jgi:hypothetical protein
MPKHPPAIDVRGYTPFGKLGDPQEVVGDPQDAPDPCNFLLKSFRQGLVVQHFCGAFELQLLRNTRKRDRR